MGKSSTVDDDSHLVPKQSSKNLSNSSSSYKGLESNLHRVVEVYVLSDPINTCKRGKNQYQKSAKDFEPGQSPCRKVLLSVGAMALAS